MSWQKLFVLNAREQRVVAVAMILLLAGTIIKHRREGAPARASVTPATSTSPIASATKSVENQASSPASASPSKSRGMAGEEPQER